MQHDHNYDLIIVGAGMVGASLACALSESDLRIAIIESVPLGQDQQPSYDDRGITLSPSSKHILNSIGVWQQLSAHTNPIKRIHITEQGRFGFTQLEASEFGRSELAYVVVARSLGQALHKRMKSCDNVQLISPATLTHFALNESTMSVDIEVKRESRTLNTRLMVGADGAQSLVRRLAGINTRQHDFKQTAIVANITTQKPNHGSAYERFTQHGPIALLPVDVNKSVLVFTVDNSDAERYLSMPDEQYKEAVELQFGRRLGRIEQLGQRRSYPIIFIEALEQYQQQLVLLGNAAHSLHPNTAQGFNLGLRDVAGLAESIINGVNNGMALDDSRILENYLSLRSADQQRVISFTNGLAKSFYNEWPIISPVRNLAMLLLDTLPSLKTPFAEKAMGLAGLQPKLVRGLPL